MKQPPLSGFEFYATKVLTRLYSTDDYKNII